MVSVLRYRGKWKDKTYNCLGAVSKVAIGGADLDLNGLRGDGRNEGGEAESCC